MSKEDKKVEKVLERKLPADVAKKYKLKTIRASKFNFKGFGEIDLRTISVAKADLLFSKKFPYLELTDEAKKEIEAAKNTKAAKIATAKEDLKEIDLTDIAKFDRNKGLSIIAHLEIPTADKKSETIFAALKETRAALQSE